MAEAWFREEYEPVVEMLRRPGSRASGTATEAYMRVAHLRYLILRTHDWDDERDRAPPRGARASQLGRGHDGEGAAEGASLASAPATASPPPVAAGCGASGGEVPSVLGVEKVEALCVHPELGLLALLDLALRVEPGDDLARLAGARHLAAAGVLGQLAQLLRLDVLVRRPP